MFKYLIAVLVIGAVNGQSVLPYQAVLDPDFIVSWDINNYTEFLTVEIFADAGGWATLKILSPSGNLLDVWWGGYDEEHNTTYLQDGNAQLVGMEVGPTYPDNLQSLRLVSGFQPPTQTTRIRFRRAYGTTDRADVPFLLGQAYTVIWGFAAKDEPQSPPIRGGFGTITWRPLPSCIVEDQDPPQ